jgi:ATP-dependent Clp protease adaptor protein ClpS
MEKIQFQEHSAPENYSSEETITDLLSRVMLFNDEWHSFDEVITQIQKATRCSFDVARALTFEVHVKGKAMVFEGALIECLRVSSVLEEIALHTQILS